MTLHVFPDAREIVIAVREFLTDEVVPGTQGALSFHARVAANLLLALERELSAGPDAEARFAAALAELGAADEAELATMIRASEIDPRQNDLYALLADITRDRLLVSNPRYLEGVIDDDPRGGDHGEREG